jgi:ABC-type lipoprotein release transport system permease subunit
MKFSKVLTCLLAGSFTMFFGNSAEIKRLVTGLVILFAFNIIFVIFRCIKEKKSIKSSIMIMGLQKKTMSLILISLLYQVQLYGFIKADINLQVGALTAFGVAEILSIFEHYIGAGGWPPDTIKKYIPAKEIKQ